MRHMSGDPKANLAIMGDFNEGHGHRGATLAQALVGGFHEGVDFQRVLDGHRRLAGLEELRDLHQQRFVPLELAGGREPAVWVPA